MHANAVTPTNAAIWPRPTAGSASASASASDAAAARGSPAPAPAWLWVLGACAAAVLVAFGFMVRRSVQDGQARRQGWALRSEAAWRCHALPGRAAREACLCRTQRDPPRDRAALQTLLEQPAPAGAAGPPCAPGALAAATTKGTPP